MTSTSATGAEWSSLTTTLSPFGSVKYSTGTLKPCADAGGAVMANSATTSAASLGLCIWFTLEARARARSVPIDDPRADWVSPASPPFVT